MPVRSLRSSVRVWPRREAVEETLGRWAQCLLRERPELWRVGCFGSLVSGGWGVGSDADVVMAIEGGRGPGRLPCGRRAAASDTSAVPVPVDFLVYTEEEWEHMLRRGGRFARLLAGARSLAEREEEA